MTWVFSPYVLKILALVRKALPDWIAEYSPAMNVLGTLFVADVLATS